MNDSSSIGSNIQITQYIAIVASVSLFIYILYLVRRKRIKEEYSLLWLLSSVAFMIFSFWREGLEFFARLVGIAYPPAALFLILLLAIFLILIHFSRIISTLTDRNITLAQELAILKMELGKLTGEEEKRRKGEMDEIEKMEEKRKGEVEREDGKTV